MAFDFKKEYKEFYMPKNKPGIVTVPSMNYIAVRGQGDPNQEDGEYKQSIGLLYGIAFTIKMSKMGDRRIDGYFDYVVPPLEGLAVGEATRKKKTDFSKAEFLTYDEGLCVQCMHIGSYDDEPATVARMHEYMETQGYVLDITSQRMHRHPIRKG